jgi:hypothetical protein
MNWPAAESVCAAAGTTNNTVPTTRVLSGIRSMRPLRTIGVVRARLKIGLQNLVYNIRRLATLERMAAA